MVKQCDVILTVEWPLIVYGAWFCTFAWLCLNYIFSRSYLNLYKIYSQPRVLLNQDCSNIWFEVLTKVFPRDMDIIYGSVDGENLVCLNALGVYSHLIMLLGFGRLCILHPLIYLYALSGDHALYCLFSCFELSRYINMRCGFFYLCQVITTPKTRLPWLMIWLLWNIGIQMDDNQRKTFESPLRTMRR